MNEPRIAVDAMGGDGEAPIMVAGCARALAADRSLRFILFGDETAIRAEVMRHRALGKAAEIVHTPEKITGDDKPAQAIRRARTTSMGQAIAAVKDRRAAAMVSAGNTGALMAMSKLALRTMPGIHRPALAALLPTLGKNNVVLTDLGANTECDADNLAQFAVMGAAYARIVLGLDRPRVALLNIGTEEMKGTEALRDAAAMLRDASHLHLRFDGFTEADRIGHGEADVIVTDGFSGNIALKTLEGTARFVTDLLRRSFASSFRSKMGFLLSRPAFKMLRVHLDPNNYNGGILLGLNGIVVKSHGGADVTGVANAIGVAARLMRDDISRRIAEDLVHFVPAPAEPLGA